MSTQLVRLGCVGLLAAASVTQAQTASSNDTVNDPALPQVTVTGERADDAFAGGQQARKARLGMLLSLIHI